MKSRVIIGGTKDKIMENKSIIKKILELKEQNKEFNTTKTLQRLNSGDKNARNELVYNLMPLVDVMAKEYTEYADYEDLLSVGTVGLLNAIDSFKLNENYTFYPYATEIIDSELINFINAKYGVKISKTEDLKNVPEKISFSNLTNELENEILTKLDDNMKDKATIDQALNFVKNNYSKRDYELFKSHFGFSDKNNAMLLKEYKITTEKFNKIINDIMTSLKKNIQEL